MFALFHICNSFHGSLFVVVGVPANLCHDLGHNRTILRCTLRLTSSRDVEQYGRRIVLYFHDHSCLDAVAFFSSLQKISNFMKMAL